MAIRVRLATQINVINMVAMDSIASIVALQTLALRVRLAIQISVTKGSPSGLLSPHRQPGRSEI